MRATLIFMLAVNVVISCAGSAGGAPAPAGERQAQAAEPFIAHPAAAELDRFFNHTPVPEDFKPTGLSRRDYLDLIASNVDFWKQHQDPAGAIIDPYEGRERQYSTPAFALASALLVREAGREDLLDASTRAMTFATAALAGKTTADNHADFYIPMLMHARRLLKERAGAAQLHAWDDHLRSIVPEQTYRAVAGGGNWTIVHVCGELLRRRDGLVLPDQMESQLAYLEMCLQRQQRVMTRFGMYEDPNVPLAYDAFPRLWLEDAMADEAYDGKFAHELREWLRIGSLSTLLLLSPSGEWPCGGRSAHHQWNEAQIALIAEIEAVHWMKRGRPDVAGSLKRAAHLCYQSMLRWRRPSGELWIVKNFADPQQRFGFEGYSFHSQYNLLAMAMLAMAYLRADDSIPEHPLPAETGAYVFDLRDIFHKVIAAAGGYYVLIDTGADPGFNATGLQRIHRSGVALSPISDSACLRRHYAPGREAAPVAAMAPAIQWQEPPDPATQPGTTQPAEAAWRALAQYTLGQLSGRAHPYGADVVIGADLRIEQIGPQRVSFTLRYALDGAGARMVEEQYALGTGGIEYSTRLPGKAAPSPTRAIFPVLVNDGARDTDLRIDGSRLSVRRRGGQLNAQLVTPRNPALALAGPRVPCHNGWMQAVVADLPDATRELRWRITLTPDEAEGRQ